MVSIVSHDSFTQIRYPHIINSPAHCGLFYLYMIRKYNYVDQ